MRAIPKAGSLIAFQQNVSGDASRSVDGMQWRDPASYPKRTS
jgi:hypothetical protein